MNNDLKNSLKNRLERRLVGRLKLYFDTETRRWDSAKDINIDLRYAGLTRLPLNFGYIGGWFDCSDNKITSLKGLPEKFRDLNASYNNLTNMIGCPTELKRLTVFNNKLTSLEGSTQNQLSVFSCSNNNLTSLDGGPMNVFKYYCYSNKVIFEKPKNSEITSFIQYGN